MLIIPLSVGQPPARQLWGATAGEGMLAEARARLASNQFAFGESKIIGFDFTGIEATNASYLKALLLPWLTGSTVGDNMFAGVLGLAPDVEDEINELLTSRKLPVYYFLQLEGQKAKILGVIEPFLHSTLQLLAQTAGGTAPELKKKSGNEIGVTGWNNRLAELSRLRLVHRNKSGRTIHYQPLAKEII